MIEYRTLSISERDTYIDISSLFSVENVTSPNMVLSLKNAGNMGTSAEISNRFRLDFFRRLGIDKERVIALNQIHSTKVFYAPSMGNDIVDGDGIYTNNRQSILSVTVADCLPIFIFHKGGGGFGVFHSGWKGTGIVNAGIDSLQKTLGIPIEELGVVIGPGIGSCCYRVDKNRAESFKHSFGVDSVVRNDDGYFLDLVAANLHLLASYPLHSVLVLRHCTSCDQHMGSYRREGSDRFTRMIALIGYF